MAAALALLGACSSGDSGCGGSDKKESNGEASSMPGGGGTGGGGLGEPVSFQGVGKKDAPPPPQQAPASASPAPAPAPASSSQPNAASQDGPQSVICGGFPDLPADCFKDPAYPKIKAKCCPSGQVEQCRGIPGGARLIGRACTAAAK